MKKRIVLVAWLMLLLMTMVPMTASAQWQNTDGKTYYYQNGKKVTGFAKIGKYTYYFDESGARVTGWKNISVSGTVQRFYFTANKGRMTTGLKKISGKYYLFSSKGYLLRGLQKKGSKTYYGKASGELARSEWVGDRYFNSKCVMAVNTTVDGRKIGADGVASAVTGWVKENGKNVAYIHSDGTQAKGFLTIGKKKYYLSTDTGSLVRGFFTVDGSLYYAGPKKGTIFTGKTFKVGKYYYTALSDGRLLTGLQTVNGNLRYYNPTNGRMTVKSKKEVGSVTYYFDKKGNAVKSKWVKIKGKYYYFGKDGKMVVSSVVDGYRIDASGVRGAKADTFTGWKTVSGNKYYYENGEKVTGWKTISGNRYYLRKKKDGLMATGVLKIDGKKYYFYPTGVLAVSTTVSVKNKEYTINANGVITSTRTVSVTGTTVGAKIAQFAIKYVGNKYVYGGTSLTNGADCSGFVQTVFANFNIRLLRVADDQRIGPGSVLRAAGYKKAVKVTASQLLPGDLVFYGSSNYASHVGIYIGDGKIVHASNSQPYPQGGIKISYMNYSNPIGYVRYWS